MCKENRFNLRGKYTTHIYRKENGMGSLLGKVFKVGLNAITPKYSKGWASPSNKGLSKLINGTQQDCGNFIRFQQGIKHAIVRVGYRDTLNQYHNLAVSCNSTGKQLAETYDKVPRCLQQAMTELSDLMAHGVNV